MYVNLILATLVAFLNSALAQFPPPLKNVQTIKSNHADGVVLTYKEVLQMDGPNMNYTHTFTEWTLRDH